MLEVNGLTKKFGDFTAVKDVAFSVAAREIFGFLGPNGAGKTTTINMLTGLAKITSGSAKLSGIDLTRHIKKAQRLMGIVPDESNLYEELDGFANLCFCASLYGLEKRLREERARQLLSQFGLADTGKYNGPKNLNTKTGGLKTQMSVRKKYPADFKSKIVLEILKEEKSLNDLGSIQSVGEMIKPVQMPGRITRGIAITGLANVLSGLLGVIGPVNFSFSPGMIASTGVASRFVLLPAAAGLLALSFVPAAISFIGGIPSVVIGTVLVYVMCSQIAAGLLMVLSDAGEFTMESGLIIGLPIMLGIIISFLPAEVLSTFPAFMRPILGNGFVVGVVAVMLLENVLYRR